MHSVPVLVARWWCSNACTSTESLSFPPAQIVMLGQRFPPSELCARIAAVTADDIQRIVVRALKSKPSMAVYGEAPNVAYDDVARIFA